MGPFLLGDESLPRISFAHGTAEAWKLVSEALGLDDGAAESGGGM